MDHEGINQAEPINGLSGKPEVRILLGGMALALTHQWLRQSIPVEWHPLSYVIGGIGFMLFLLGAWCVENRRYPAWLERFFISVSVWGRISVNQLVAAIFAILFTITATEAAGYDAKMFSPVISTISWAVGIGLAIMAGWEKKVLSPRQALPVLKWAGIIFLVAFILRGVDTTHVPIVLSGDEASSGLYSIDIIKGYTNNIFNVGWFSFPSLYFFLQSIAIRILGNTTVGLRITASIIGTLTVVCLYLIVRAMYGQRTALLAAVFLGFSHFHINFSRIGLNNVWDGLGFVTSIGGFWYAWQKERRAAFILAGLAVGLTQYFYTSGRGVLAVIPVWVVIAAIADRKKFKRLLPDLLLFGLAVFVVLLPLIWFFATHPHEFRAPMERVSIWGDWLRITMEQTGKPSWQVVGGQILTALLSFTDQNLRHWYTPGTAILRPVAAFLFYIGTGLLVLKIKDSRSWFILLWLGVFVAAGALSESTPAAQRYVAAVPACMIVVAYAVNRLIEIGVRIWPRWEKRLTNVLLIGAMLVAMDDSRFYFLDYTPRSDFSGFNGQVAQHLANYLQDYDSSWEVVFYGWPTMGYYSIPSIAYLAPHIKGLDNFKPWGDPENPVPDRKNLMFVFLPDHEDEFYACQALYPDGEVWTEYGKNNLLLFYLYKVRLP